MRLANKTAFITGGNSGIGLATARLFVKEGVRVAITGRNQATLEAAAKELGPNTLAIVADATDIAATEKAIAQAVEKFGKLDIVFANAGISASTPVGGTSVETFESVLKTNITAVFFTVQAAAPHLKDGASIILNGSVISVLGNPGYAAYAASKAGVRAMTPGDGLGTVAARHPGQCRIAGWHHHADLESHRAPTPEAIVALEKRIWQAVPLGRFGKPEEVAKTVLFLASDDASTSRLRKFSSMAARRDRLQARRSIADKWNLHCGQLELPENHESCQHDLTKNRIAVVLLGSIAPQTYFAELRGGIEPWSLQARHLGGQVL